MRYNEKIYSDNCGMPLVRTYRSGATNRKNYYFEHHHTECELCICIGGCGVYAVGNKKYRFKSGDAFLFGSNEAHCITDCEGEIRLLNLQFEPRILWESRENAELLALFYERGENFCNKCENDAEIIGLTMSIELELSERKRGYKVAVRSLILSLLLHILRSYDYVVDERRGAGANASADKLGSAMDYINENLDRKLTLEGIAATACMTPTYFSAVFKKYNGISPWEYITIKRVGRAIDMIKGSDMTKLEIAARCGFSSPSHFYKAFRAVTGKSPKDFENK